MISVVVESLPSLIVMSTALFVVVWLIERIVGDRFPHFRLVLWSGVLLRLFIPPSLFIAWTFSPSWFGVGSTELTWNPAATVHTALTAGEGQSLVNEVSLAGVALISAWILGSSLVFGRWIGARRRRLRSLSAKETAPGSRLRHTLESWRVRFRIRRRVRIMLTEESSIAFTTGVVRPTIYIPAAMERRLSGEALSAVVGHELAHVKRLDDLWLTLETLVRSVYFFHPVVWFTTARLRQVREQLTDELVIDVGDLDGHCYGSALLDSVSLHSGVSAMPALVESSRRALEQRLVRVAKHRKPRRRAAASAAGLLMVMMLLPAGVEATTAAPATPLTLRHPVPEARITSSFGPRRDPFSNEQSVHQGVDFAAARDTIVRAAAPGVVVTATERYERAPEQGTVVLIRHGEGLHTFYSHLGGLLVGEGETIAAGQPIARIGSTGRVTGPHLHFEVIIGDQSVDPIPMISAGGER